MKISAVINTRNEAEYLVDCLESLSWVDEIVVVDMESIDTTRDIAYRFTKQVYTHPAMDYVEPARNFGIKHATGDWILVMDPDERVPASLAKRLIDLAEESKYNFIRIPRKNMIFNTWVRHSRWWPDYNIRFFQRDQVEWQDNIHSVPITYGEGHNLPDEEQFAITHLNYVSLEEYFGRLQRYSTIQADQLIKEGYRFFWVDLISKPMSEFLSRFFAGAGYKDGLHGFILSILQGFSEFVVFLKVWEKQGFEPKTGLKFQFSLLKLFDVEKRELDYWITTLKIELAETKIKKFLLRLRRRLHL